MKILWNDEELQCINEHGCVCLSVAENAMKRNNINFDDIERINNHFEEHQWGSNADRIYRKRAVNKAIKVIASNPLIEF